MARRKNDLASKLQGGSRRPGWQDTITGPPQPRQEAEEEEEESRTSSKSSSGRSSSLKRKTYLLTPELIAQVETLADAERVGISELVRFLLRSALEQAEAGELTIPTRTESRRIVQH